MTVIVPTAHTNIIKLQPFPRSEDAPLGGCEFGSFGCIPL